jgi:hypothetical protein
VLASLRKLVFGISPAEASFDRRGFRGSHKGVRARLEQIGRAFVSGYHAALEEDDPQLLELKLNTVALEFRGFAYEGAAMGLALLDWLTPWKRHRVQAFLRGPGDAHAYMVHVGVGWALARLPANLEKARTRLEPLLGWLAIDGYGFHEGFFHWPRYLQGRAVPKRVTGYSQRAFDLGLGRSLWFVDGADVSLIPGTISGFPVARQPELWSGLGLACAYAGGLEDEAALRALKQAAGPFQAELAQGAAFASKARVRAGNLTPHTRLACQVLCGLPAEEAAQITDEALENLPANGAEPAFEIWRRRIQDRFKQTKELKP